MNWFKNAKIKTKLLTCFILLAILTGIVGSLGIYDMYVLNDASNEMYYERLIPIEDLSTIQKNLLLIRSNFLLLTYERNENNRLSRIEGINQLYEANDALIDKYSKTNLDDAEKAELKQLNDSLVPYRRFLNECLELIKEGRYDEADALIPEFAKARERVDATIDELIKINTDAAEQLNIRNAASFRLQSIIMVSISLLGVVLAIVIGLYIASIISKPLAKLVKAADKIAQGDLDVDIDIDTKDEVGSLAQAFRNMTDNINEVMTNISSASEQVASGAKQVSDSSMELSQGATEQASSIEELTASIEEIASQTRLNAENADQANKIAEDAKENAIRGNEQMKDMLKAMDEINDSSSNISRIIKVIDEIAFQTNILALNAAVEAARAGQHGKGFAVVAEEVRNLAARSANAAKETTAMIEGSIKKVDGGTKIANETAQALNRIVDGVAKVANLVGDIALASNEQAAGIAQVNQGISQVSEVVQTNSATSEESAAASEELSGQAELLKEQVNRFNLKRRKSYHSNREIEEINPDVLRMLDNMNNKKKERMYSKTNSEVAATSTKKIVLSDKEFGKY